MATVRSGAVSHQMGAGVLHRYPCASFRRKASVGVELKSVAVSEQRMAFGSAGSLWF